MTAAFGEILYWLERRLGCAGKERLRILQAIAQQGHVYDELKIEQIGLTKERLSSLSRIYNIPLISQNYPSRGDTESLLRIAWWGSAWGDVACIENDKSNSLVLKESALFNLAIALFDTVVDEYPNLKSEITKIINPFKIRRRLYQPSKEYTALICDHPLLGCIAHIFNDMLSSIGLRLSDQPQHLERIAQILESMYKSELRLSSNPFNAKRLPLLFIGLLSNVSYRCDVCHLFECIGDFIHLWDDWLDLSEDMIRLAPNAFLGSTIKNPLGIYTLIYLCRSFSRILAGSFYHKQIANLLAAKLEMVVASAKRVGPNTFRKTAVLCNYLVT